MPTGTLIRKIGRQSQPKRFALISRPPSSGPLTVPSPAVTPKPASALIRSTGGKVTWITASTCGIMMPPIAPCKTRKAISCQGSGPRRTART